MTDLLEQAVELAKAYGDASEAAYRLLAAEFVKAHQAAPGGLTIEVGTRFGGSALLMLTLLRGLYPVTEQTLVITVDPYGGKPYKTGRPDVPTVEQLYGDVDYRAMKVNLSGFANHVHFPLASRDFLSCLNVSLWQRGKEILLGGNDSVSFVYLDGDHDAHTIIQEMVDFADLLKVGGEVVIDNATDDSSTIPLITKAFIDPEDPVWMLGQPLKDTAVLKRLR